MIEAMQRIPGNQHFLRRFEYTTTMRHYFGQKGFVVGQVVLIICLQSLAIASIVVSSQVVDDFLIFAFGHRYE